MNTVKTYMISLLIIAFSFSSLFPDEFDAEKSSDWRQKETWKKTAGSDPDAKYPGEKKTRSDEAVVPEGKKVTLEGGTPGNNKKGERYMDLKYLTVNGEVTTRTTTRPIQIRTENDVVVGENGSINGQSVDLVSTDGCVTVNGEVVGNGGSVNIDSKNGVIVGENGTAASYGGSTKIKSRTGGVEVKKGGSVHGTRGVSIESGKKNNIIINGSVTASKGNIILKADSGAVVIGKNANVLAFKNEIKITADSLHIAGTIKCKSLHKNCNKVTVEDSAWVFVDGDRKNQNDLANMNKIIGKLNMEEGNGDIPAEEGPKCAMIGIENVVLDFSSRPNAIVADSTVLVGTGFGGMIDFTGISPGTYVIDCPGTIEIYADSIGLDPGVSIGDICGPGYVTTGPSKHLRAVATLCVNDGVGYPSMPVDVDFNVMNMGNVSDSYTITANNQLGWPFTVSDSYIYLDYLDPSDSTITITIDVPSYSMPMLDSILVWVDCISNSNPNVKYTDSTFVPVHDVSELKGVTIFEYDLQSGDAGDTALVYSQIMNCGYLDDEYDLIVTDSLGWEIIPPSDFFFLASLHDTIYCTRIVIPFDAVLGEINKVYFEAQSVSSPSVTSYDTVAVEVGNVTGIEEDRIVVVGDYLSPSYPNPFNPSTTIVFGLKETSEVTIRIYDVSGKLVRILLGPIWKKGGQHAERWDGRNDGGKEVVSGVYFYSLKAGDKMLTRKMVVIR